MMLWAVGGVTALCGALCYAELGAALPRSGGEYNFLTEIYHPAAGYISGWVSATIGFAAPTALASITFGTYLSSIFPELSPTWLACGLILALTGVHASNHRNSGGVQRAFTAIKILLILGFCLFCWVLVDEPQDVRFLPRAGDGGLLASGAFAVALIYVNYAYAGWNAATYLTSELEDPQRSLTRVLVLGASTVMGTYATTGQTSSEQLEILLAQRRPERHVRVINAGIQGLTLEAQSRLLERRVSTLRPELIFWYPGSNDVSCRSSARAVGRARRPPLRLPVPELPLWVLSSDLLVKNTRFLRERPGGANGNLVPDFDVESMRATVERVAGIARNAGAQLVLVTAAHSYRSSMSDRELAIRASSALFFRPCYSPRELATRVDQMTAMLRDEAARLGLPLVDAAAAIPPEPRLFGDASHFSPAGEREFARVLAAEVGRLGL